ncbi:hypothetical protein FRAHR75_510030 [Frankia sp. Hr75.2]|nr:hypothetical protein FRAHR75_510030 [Frankia sp. Hr75.2]
MVVKGGTAGALLTVRRAGASLPPGRVSRGPTSVIHPTGAVKTTREPGQPEMGSLRQRPAGWLTLCASSSPATRALWAWRSRPP